MLTAVSPIALIFWEALSWWIFLIKQNSAVTKGIRSHTKRNTIRTRTLAIDRKRAPSSIFRDSQPKNTNSVQFTKQPWESRKLFMEISINLRNMQVNLFRWTALNASQSQRDLFADVRASARLFRVCDRPICKKYQTIKTNISFAWIQG